MNDGVDKTLDVHKAVGNVVAGQQLLDLLISELFAKGCQQVFELNMRL